MANYYFLWCVIFLSFFCFTFATDKDNKPFSKGLKPLSNGTVAERCLYWCGPALTARPRIYMGDWCLKNCYGSMKKHNPKAFDDAPHLRQKRFPPAILPLLPLVPVASNFVYNMAARPGGLEYGVKPIIKNFWKNGRVSG